MPEALHGDYELTPTGLRQRITNLGLEYLPYTQPSRTFPDAAELKLLSTTGEKIRIIKPPSAVGARDTALQDLLVVVAGGERLQCNESLFNFGVTDGGDELRRTDIDKIQLAQSSLDKGAVDDKRGLFNTPATAKDIAELMGYLDGAAVLDPATNEPVATV